MERWRIINATPPAPDEAPIVLARTAPHGPVVHAANAAAEGVGVRAGARVVDMHALCPHLRVFDADPQGDRQALDRLVMWARRWCPWSAADGETGLVLDTTGSDHLWGGEAAMLKAMKTDLAGIGLGARPALAPSRGAAWALARYGPEAAIVATQDDIFDALAPLPVEALRLDGETVLVLRRLGLKTIGALAEVPRLALARRFSGALSSLEAPLRRLDQAFGRRAEPVVSAAEPERFRALVRLAEPVVDVAPFLPGLADDLCARLGARGMGARRLTLMAFRVDGDVGVTAIAMSRPSRAPRHFARLFDGRLDGLDPGFGFDAIALEADRVEPLHAAQARFEGGEDGQIALGFLIDRLVARFGHEAVTRPGLRESHMPERAEFWAPALAGTANALEPVSAPERPLRLLTHPEEIGVVYSVPDGPPARFIWRRLDHRVVRYEGPERIAPEWWRERSNARLRDYYRIEDDQGRRYWLFREGLLGDGRGGPPRWFMHGLFP